MDIDNCNLSHTRKVNYFIIVHQYGYSYSASGNSERRIHCGLRTESGNDEMDHGRRAATTK